MNNTDILQETGKQLLLCVMLSGDMKNSCHMWGLNGFKRWHRYNAMCFYKELEGVKSHSIDYYGKELNIKDGYVKPIYSKIDTMLEYWLNGMVSFANFLDGSIHNLQAVQSNMDVKLLSRLLCYTYNQIKLIRRIIVRFEATGYMQHDIRVLDSKLHRKYKHKEIKKHNIID